MPTVNFERGPSNEQTLLSELGEAKRQLTVTQQSWERCLDTLQIVVAERDTLAVTAERMRLALLRIANHPQIDTYEKVGVSRIVADALLVSVEELEGME